MEESKKEEIRQLYTSLTDSYSKVSGNYSIFSISLSCYAEAIKCFTAGSPEASMIMCRNAIDSAIVEFAIKDISKVNDNATFWNLKILFGTNHDWFDVYGKADTNTKEVLRHFALKEIRRVGWPKLKQIAIGRMHINKDEIKRMAKIREMGNYSAHRAQKIIESMIQSFESGNPFKFATYDKEAGETLKETKEALKLVYRRYFLIRRDIPIAVRNSELLSRIIEVPNATA